MALSLSPKAAIRVVNPWNVENHMNFINIYVFAYGGFVCYKFNYINRRRKYYRVNARELASFLMDPTSIRAFEDRQAESASAKAENVLAFLFWQWSYWYNTIKIKNKNAKYVHEMVYIYRYEKCIDVTIYLWDVPGETQKIGNVSCKRHK